MDKKRDKGVFLVILAALVSMFPATIFSVGIVDIDLFKIFTVLTLLVFLVTAALKVGFFVPKTMQLPLLTIMFSWFLLTGFWSRDISLTISHSFVLSFFIIFFMMVLLFTRSRDDLYRWVYCLSITVIVALMYNFGYLQAQVVLRQADRALINTLGVAAEISILPASFIFLFNKNPLTRVYSLVVFMACGLALMLSANRGGLFAVVFNIAVFSFLLLRSRKVRVLGIASVIVLVVLIVVLAANRFLPEVKGFFLARWTGTFNPDVIHASATSYYWEENPRVELWTAALRMFESKPVVGVGFGAFREEIAIVNSSLSYWTFPHNTYLAVLSETGLVGLIIFLLLIGVSLNNYHVAASYLRIKGTGRDYFWVTTMEVTFWGLLLHSALRPALFEFPLYLFMALSHVSRTVFLKRHETTSIE